MAFLTNCLFVGKEAEGNDLGRKTLFIGDKDAPVDYIKRVLAADPEITAVYFGASNNRGVAKNHRELLAELSKTYVVRLEIDSVADLQCLTHDTLSSVEVILVIPVTDLSKAYHVKAIKYLAEDSLAIHYVDQVPYITNFDNPEFDKDIQV